MEAYNVITENIENLEEIFTKKLPSDRKFLTIAPHTGEHIPLNYLKNVYKSAKSWKKDVDHVTSELYDLIDVESGLITTNIHRDFVDLNRSLSKENDGIIKNEGFDGTNILIKDYTSFEKDNVLSNFYSPFYNMLNKEMFELRKKYDTAFLLNGHSMENSSPKNKEDREDYPRPDFCIGTLSGTSATKKITNTFVNTLTELAREEKLDVKVDYPFKGQGNLSKIYSFPKRGYNTLLLEVNQKLYVKEDYSIDYESLKNINGIIKTTMDETLKVIR